jgi:DNA-binding XRE family transcriptional regulator
MRRGLSWIVAGRICRASRIVTERALARLPWKARQLFRQGDCSGPCAPVYRTICGTVSSRRSPVCARRKSELLPAMTTKSPNPVDKYVGSRVRMRRMMLAMSQEKLGDALGLSFQQVQKYEKGANRIGASRLSHRPAKKSLGCPRPTPLVAK